MIRWYSFHVGIGVSDFYLGSPTGARKVEASEAERGLGVLVVARTVVEPANRAQRAATIVHHI